MTLRDTYWINVALGMSNKRASVVQVRTGVVAGQNYINQVGQTLKDGTAAGQLMLSIEDFSKGNLLWKGVSLMTEDDAADFPAPDENAFAFDKLTVLYTAGFDRGHFTIPARDATKYTLADDGITVITGSAGTQFVQDLVSRVEAIVLGKNGSTVTVDKIYVSS